MSESLSLRLRDIQAIGKIATDYDAAWVDIRQQKMNQPPRLLDNSLRTGFVLAIYPASDAVFDRARVDVLFLPGRSDGEEDVTVLLDDSRRSTSDPEVLA